MIFISLLFKIFPLYLLILLWFLSSKYLWVKKEWIATILIYIIAPIVIFYWTFTAELTLDNILIPAIFFVLSSLIALLFLYIWKYFYWEDSTKNILAFTSWTGNTWYYWLPVITALLWPEYFSVAVLAILWFVLYENTLWFYLTAKGNFTKKQSLIKVLKLPTVYAFLLWVILQLIWVEFWVWIISLLESFKWSYSVLWIMIIGMWLASVNLKAIDMKFIWLTFSAKFIVWPLVVWTIVFMDRQLFQVYWSEIHTLFMVMSIVPLASNTIALATELKTHPDKASLAVLLSTIFALFYIPLVVSLFL